MGLLLRRTLDLRAAFKLGILICFDEIHAEELAALLVFDQEHDRLDREKLT